MATTTTNFGWDIPQSTDLVKDGATAIAALGQDIDTAMVDLKGGTTGQVLAKASGTDLDFTWVTDAAGDITGVTAGTGITGGGTSGTVTVSIDTAVTADLSSAQTLSRKTLKAPEEFCTVTATAATGTINFDLLTQGVLYYTTNASANFTLNFRGNSGTTLDSIMTTGESISAVFLNTNGGTAYYPTAFQIDGSSVTPKWSGGTAPSSGNTSSIDAYSFTIIKTGSAAFTVLAGGAVKFA
jgi:hypothetical protein